MTRIIGALCVLAALGCALGARRLVKKKRYYVICRAPKRMVKIEAKDEIQQTMIMVTVERGEGQSAAAEVAGVAEVRLHAREKSRTAWAKASGCSNGKRWPASGSTMKCGWRSCATSVAASCQPAQ